MTKSFTEPIQPYIYRGFILRGKAVGHEADHSVIFSADIKAGWRSACSLSYVFVMRCVVQHEDHFICCIIYCIEILRFVISRNATAEWLLLGIREFTASRLYDVGYAEEILEFSQHLRKCNVMLYFKMSCVCCC